MSGVSNCLRFAGSLLLAAAMVPTGAVPARAQIYKSGDLTVTGNIAATTDYIFRGVSQSRRDPTVQSNLDLTYKYLYLGAFVSGIDFGRDDAGTLTIVETAGSRKVANVEVDYYGGVKFPLGSKVDIDLGVIYYAYHQAFDGPGRLYDELDYVEGKLGVTFKATDALTLATILYVSPEYTNKTGDVLTVEGTISYALPTVGSVATTISGLIAVQTGNDARFETLIANGRDSYFYWNVGPTFTFAERLSIDVRYWGTNIKDDNAAAGFADNFCRGVVLQCTQTVVGTVKVTF